MKRDYIVTAAGGNATFIRVLDEPLSRGDYSKIGGAMIRNFQNLSVEQAGFLILANNHFEMSGGEFCGNAARAAALILSILNRPSVFTMSGFDGKISSSVTGNSVRCQFLGLKPLISQADNFSAKIVDLGGIVHVVIDSPFPDDYTQQHRLLTDALGLRSKAAVGVIWTSIDGDRLRIDPVVWVKEIDSFFYESSCGSGSIAAATITGIKKIVQPTSQIILSSVGDDLVVLESEMEVIYEN